MELRHSYFHNFFFRIFIQFCIFEFFKKEQMYSTELDEIGVK
jgi:hypothetical protein